MRRLIPVLMSNVCYLAVIMIFLVATARYLSVTTGQSSLTGWLMLVTGGYRSLLLVSAFSMNMEL